MRIMKSAALCGMPKLLACCEYCIVFDALKKSPEHTALRARCLSDEQLSRSWSHIAEGSFIAFQRNYDPALHARFDTIPCECRCCQLVRKDPTLPPHRVDPARWLSLMVYEPAGRGFESRWLIAGFSDLSGLKWVRDDYPGIERSHEPH